MRLCTNRTQNLIQDAGTLLFPSDHVSWPAFYEAVEGKIVGNSHLGALTIVEDNSYGMHRIEMRCKKCNGHLGHIFKVEYVIKSNN